MLRDRWAATKARWVYLTFGTQDGEAVRLELDVAAEQRIGEAQAVVDGRQRDRRLTGGGSPARSDWKSQPAMER